MEKSPLTKFLSYECQPPIATVIISRATYDMFMYKLYHVMGYEKKYIHLAVTCRYPIIEEYIPLPTPIKRLYR